MSVVYYTLKRKLLKCRLCGKGAFLLAGSRVSQSSSSAVGWLQTKRSFWFPAPPADMSLRCHSAGGANPHTVGIEPRLYSTQWFKMSPSMESNQPLEPCVKIYNLKKHSYAFNGTNQDACLEGKTNAPASLRGIFSPRVQLSRCLRSGGVVRAIRRRDRSCLEISPVAPTQTSAPHYTFPRVPRFNQPALEPAPRALFGIKPVSRANCLIAGVCVWFAKCVRTARPCASAR